MRHYLVEAQQKALLLTQIRVPARSKQEAQAIAAKMCLGGIQEMPETDVMGQGGVEILDVTLIPRGEND